jgi:hypothetical protein
MLGNCLFNGMSQLETNNVRTCVLGMEMEITSTAESIADNIQENFETHMYTLSHFIFLWYWFFDSMENMPKEKVCAVQLVIFRKNRELGLLLLNHQKMCV